MLRTFEIITYIRISDYCPTCSYMVELLFYLTLSASLSQSQIHAGSLLFIDLHVDDFAKIYVIVLELAVTFHRLDRHFDLLAGKVGQ